MLSPRMYRFDEFTLDPATMCLSRGSEQRALEPKSFRLLHFLIENRDRVLSKEEIFRIVWQETNVTDNALTRTVAQVRKALDDDPRHPRYIDTVPTVGYRFIGTLAEEPAPAPEKTPSQIRLWLAVGTAVVVVAALAAWILWPKKPMPSASGPIPFTTYRGSENAPSFSPDGSQVAFQWDGEKEDNYDIYVKGLGPDAAPLRLTTDPAPDKWPAWSPDGATIAFLRIVAPNKADLILIPALGGPERKLAEFPIWSDRSAFAPAWSADSKWLVTPVVVGGNHAALFRISVETGEMTQMTHPDASLEDHVPTISPDGKTLLYLTGASYAWGSLYAMRIDGNANPIEQPHHIPSGNLPVGKPVWTADGKEIIVSSRNGVIRMPAEGSDNPERFWSLGTNVGQIDLSRHGDRMVYSLLHGDANVWRIDLTAKEAHPERLIASTARDVFPQYSPDGKQLAFYSDRSGGFGQIWISDSEGKQARQLTFADKQAGTPHWSPDGKTLTIDSNDSSSSQVYTVSPNGGKPKALTQGPTINFGATWSRDGKWMYFSSKRTGRNEVWKMPDGGGPAVQITHNGGIGCVESRDGKTLYYGKEAGAGSIWKMPAAGGPEEQIADSLFRYNFAVTTTGIYYMTSANYAGTSTLKFYSFVTGTTRIILEMGVPEYGLDVSPDGRYLVYVQLDDPASDLMLVNNFR